MAMAEPIDTRLADEPTVAALAPVRMEGSLVRPAADTGQIERSFRQYVELCERLLVPDDFQQIGNKSFRKKSAWRKLAVAFGVSCEIRSREYEREGRHIIRAEVVERATAPNGRFMDGLGACDAFERCCESPCKKKGWRNHTCCEPDCSGFVHFSKPNHDIPATAATRARNRACADLFGMGEVSAEEVTDPDVHDEPPPQAQRGNRSQPKQSDPDAEFRSLGWPDHAAELAWRAFYTERFKKFTDPKVKQDAKFDARNLGLDFGKPIPKEVADDVDELLAEYLTPGPTTPPEADGKPETAAEKQKCPDCGLTLIDGADCSCAPF